MSTDPPGQSFLGSWLEGVLAVDRCLIMVVFSRANSLNARVSVAPGSPALDYKPFNIGAISCTLLIPWNSVMLKIGAQQMFELNPTG